MISKKKAGRLTKFGRIIHQKNKKKSQKLVQWIEDKAKGQPRTVSTEENMDLIAAPYAFSTKNNRQTNRNQSVINTENGEKKKQFKRLKTPQTSEGTRNRRETRANSL